MALRALCLAAGLLGACRAGPAPATDPISDEVALLQLSPAGVSVAQGRAAGVSSFLSDDEAYCAEGPPRLAQAALATFQASPEGRLFNRSTARVGTSCASRNYGTSAGEDPCFPGLQTFSSMGSSVYRAVHGLDRTTRPLLVQCTCHPHSQWRQEAGDACSSLASVTGSFASRDPETGIALVCEEGPFVQAARALAALKASSRLAMNPEQVAPRNCSSRGFPVEFFNNDDCYPAMQSWTRGFFLSDQGCGRSTVLTEGTVPPLVNNFSLRAGLDAQFVGNYSCSCLAGSRLAQRDATICAQHGTAGRSPVLDFWDGSV